MCHDFSERGNTQPVMSVNLWTPVILLIALAGLMGYLW